MPVKENAIKKLWELVQEFLRLYLENAKLTVAEKVTVLVTTAALAVVGTLFFVIIFFFLSLGLANLLAIWVGNVWSYVIISGAYVVVLALLVLLRKPLIMNPIARFLTRLIFTA